MRFLKNNAWHYRRGFQPPWHYNSVTWCYLKHLKSSLDPKLPKEAQPLENPSWFGYGSLPVDETLLYLLSLLIYLIVAQSVVIPRHEEPSSFQGTIATRRTSKSTGQRPCYFRVARKIIFVSVAQWIWSKADNYTWKAGCNFTEHKDLEEIKDH